MTLASHIAGLRSAHRDCCITDSYVDEGCRLDVRGLEPHLTTIHGSNYQANHQWPGRLCDRIIIGESGNGFVCAVEFKGGNSIDMSVAIEQIQRGLDLAASLLPGQQPEKWYPLLLYSGHNGKREQKMLMRNKVAYKGKKERVERIDCGASLLNYLNRS